MFNLNRSKILNIIEELQKLIIKPKETRKVSNFNIWILRIMRGVIFLAGVNQVIFHDPGMGLMVLLVFFSLVLPTIFTNGRIKNIPTELEVFLFIAVIFQYWLGEIHNFYYTVPYYDKLVHLFSSFVIAVIAYIVVFAMQAFGKLQASNISMIIMVILIAMGIGAIWEIIEYALDYLRVNYFPHWVVFQGSLVEEPHEDTMNDLIGGLLGAVFTWKYLLSNRHDSRTKEILADINKQVFE